MEKDKILQTMLEKKYKNTILSGPGYSRINKKELLLTLKVKDLKEYINNLPDDMDVWIVSNDMRPIRRLVGISHEIKQECYSELYLDTKECDR